MGRRVVLYDEALFEYVDRNALRLANGVLPLLHQVLDVQRVLDVGCRHGACLAAGVTSGVENVTGIDGGCVDTAQLQFLRDGFMVHIFEKIFDAVRRYRIPGPEKLEDIFSFGYKLRNMLEG